MSAAEPAGEPAADGGLDELGRLAGEAWEVVLAADPLFATSLGDRRFDDRLADNWRAARSAHRSALANLLDRARALPQAGLAGEPAVTRAALVGFLEMELAIATADINRWTIDPLEGPQVALLNLASYQAVDEPADGDRMTARWRAMGPYVDQHTANVLTALDDGFVSPAAPIRAVVHWSEGARQRFAAGLRTAVEESVRPAFARYRSVLVDRVQPRARPDDRPGIAELPGGRADYARLTRAHSSLDLSADEIHAIGLAEVERIDGYLVEAAGRAIGLSERSAAIERLRTDPALRFATSAQVFATGQAALDRAIAALPDWFGILPGAGCVIVEMGAHEAAHSTIAYYLQPAEDGSRPGRYYLNTSAPETRPRYEAEALAFHESVPGHHLQLAIAQELTGLPAFRRHAGTTAFIEGWGLYCERLSDEMGLYTGDLDRIGIASFDGWRACRLVVDTGIHALGWSRDRAIAYMLEHTALAPGNIANEVDRYISWPGQAVAYKLGQLEIHRLREEARSRLAGRFDIRAFHDAVLSEGALPLSTLRSVVEARLPG